MWCAAVSAGVFAEYAWPAPRATKRARRIHRILLANLLHEPGKKTPGLIKCGDGGEVNDGGDRGDAYDDGHINDGGVRGASLMVTSIFVVDVTTMMIEVTK